jgi:hypothetical protein
MWRGRAREGGEHYYTDNNKILAVIVKGQSWNVAKEVKRGRVSESSTVTNRCP